MPQLHRGKNILYVWESAHQAAMEVVENCIAMHPHTGGFSQRVVYPPTLPNRLIQVLGVMNDVVLSMAPALPNADPWVGRLQYLGKPRPLGVPGGNVGLGPNAINNTESQRITTISN